MRKKGEANEGFLVDDNEESEALLKVRETCDRTPGMFQAIDGGRTGGPLALAVAPAGNGKKTRYVICVTLTLSMSYAYPVFRGSEQLLRYPFLTNPQWHFMR